MEQISNILEKMINAQQEEEGTRIRSQDSSEQKNSTFTEKNEEQFKVRSDVAIAEGWAYNEAPPEPKKCVYCGQPLYHYGMVNPLRKGQKHIYLWLPEPERCTCTQAQKYWQQVDAEKKAEEEERKRREEQRRIQERVNKLIKDSGIRGRFLNRTFDTFQVNEVNKHAYKVSKEYADNFSAMLPRKNSDGMILPPEKEPNGLFISGSYGTGKTHLAAAISNQLLREGVPVICMTMIDLLARIKQTYDRSDEATEADIMRIYEEVPLLVIDDIGSEQPTEWGATTIYAIINARYEAYMPVVVTTNYAGDELIRRMTPIGPSGRPLSSKNAEKTVDRLYEMCAGVEMNWESWRVKR